MLRRNAAILMIGLFSCTGCDFLTNTETRLARAEEQMAAGDVRTARIELQNVLQKEPGNARAHADLAEVSFRLGDLATAEKELALALQAGRTPDSTADLAARIRLAKGEFAELLSQVDSHGVRLQEPERSLYRARALLGLRRANEAATVFSALLETHPNLMQAHVGRAEARGSMGDARGALEDLDAAVAIAPAAARAWFMRGTLLAQVGRHAEAEGSLSKAREHARGQLVPVEYAAVLSALTVAHLSRGDVAGARAVHGELQKQFPDSAATRMLASRIALMQGDTQTAIAGLQQLVTAVPDYFPARLLLASAYQSSGQRHRAISEYEQIVRGAPDNAIALNNLAWLYFEVQDRRAEETARKAYELAPRAPAISDTYGWLLVQAGKAAEGREVLAKTIEAAPRQADFQYHYAVALARTGDSEQARQVLSALLKSSSRFDGRADAERMLAELGGATPPS